MSNHPGEGEPSDVVACPNCGEPGDPGHHWMDDPVFQGYVCFGKE